MARLEADAKAGFYPTPPVEMEHIIKRISSNVDDVTLLDPCAGEGFALKQLRDHLQEQGINSITYGIELEETRAREARNQLDNVLHCGYEEARMSNNAFSFMYLNPPFSQYGGERLETIFFRDLTRPNRYLPSGSVVVLNLPQHALKDVSNLVAQRLEDVKVYRFSDENFYNYRQVIVYGVMRRKRGSRNQEIKELLERYAYLSKDEITSLEVEDDVMYYIPKAEREVSIFETNFVSEEDIIHSLEESNVLDVFEGRISNPNIDSLSSKRPAMPLKTSHMATAIASGALPEEMGDHLLVGVTKIQKSEDTEIDEEKGITKDIELYQSKSLIRVFTKDGIFDLE